MSEGDELENGYDFSLHSRLGEIENKVDAGLIQLTNAIRHLTTNVKKLGETMGSAVPIRLVYLLFALVFGLVFGVEAIKYFFQQVLPHWPR